MCASHYRVFCRVCIQNMTGDRSGMLLSQKKAFEPNCGDRHWVLLAQINPRNVCHSPACRSRMVGSFQAGAMFATNDPCKYPCKLYERSIINQAHPLLHGRFLDSNQGRLWLQQHTFLARCHRSSGFPHPDRYHGLGVRVRTLSRLGRNIRACGSVEVVVGPVVCHPTLPFSTVLDQSPGKVLPQIFTRPDLTLHPTIPLRQTGDKKKVDGMTFGPHGTRLVSFVVKLSALECLHPRKLTLTVSGNMVKPCRS